MAALHCLSGDAAHAEFMLEEGLLPHTLALLKDSKCLCKKEALCLLARMLPSADQRTLRSILEADSINVLLQLCRFQRVDLEGQAAAAEVLAALSEMDGEGPSVVMNMVDNRGVETMIGLLGGAMSGGLSMNGKHKKKSGRAKSHRPLTPTQMVLQHCVAVLLSKMVLHVDAPPQLLRSQGLARVVNLLESDNEKTRSLIRGALWNMNYFGLSSEMVDRFSIGSDIAMEIRDRPLKDIYAEHAPMRCFSAETSRAHSAARMELPSIRRPQTEEQPRLVLPPIRPPRSAPAPISPIKSKKSNEFSLHGIENMGGMAPMA
eukprot:CAMPEP_0196589916 /NCGR_PEP_ID=MMETSP1081-20130531/65006_1 /TAXON_ID=36882 /ORGANISM="Pyramimonas amylifera, Strain CCMP720" /LENGTH=317 /DNA_ID=CAMNT_0041912853 /DNA_START=336 /DNA_END=1289 /DNA_ORIENTATION=+